MLADRKSNLKLFIKSYGCQMNVYDADRMSDLLLAEGYSLSADLSTADVIILNTCHIREKATEKIYSELGRLCLEKNKRKKVGKKTVLAVGGCVGQAEGEEIIKRAPFVDLVFGPQTYHNLPKLLDDVFGFDKKIVDTSFPVSSKFDNLVTHEPSKPFSAFLTVQEGCDKFCSFCVVPYTRGAEYSRPVDQIYSEAATLAEKGVKEITLLGQNVNNYHGVNSCGREFGLGRLIKKLSKISGLERIRYTTSYPADMNTELINAHKNVKALMPFLHLPIQSGSNRILKLMKRRHSVEDYRELVSQLRSAEPNIAMSSDFMVGFPGESASDFDDTMSLVEEIKFANAFSFKFSARPGTPAARFGGQITEEVKSIRLERLQDLLNAQQLEFNQECVGKSLPVLLENVGKQNGKLVGRSPFMQLVHVEAPKDFLGKIANLKILGARKSSLFGELL